jgi:hypothetical protein
MKHKAAPTVQVIATSRRLVGIRGHSMRWREAGSDTLLYSHSPLLYFYLFCNRNSNVHIIIYVRSVTETCLKIEYQLSELLRNVDTKGDCVHVSSSNNAACELVSLDSSNINPFTWQYVLLKQSLFSLSFHQSPEVSGTFFDKIEQRNVPVYGRRTIRELELESLECRNG